MRPYHSTLDELERNLGETRDVSLDSDSAEMLLSTLLEMLFVTDRHVRRRAMVVLPKVAPKVVHDFSDEAQSLKKGLFV